MAGLYIHVPFCLRKCFYCDFYSVDDKSQIQNFLSGLEKEIQLRSKILPDNLTFSTIYFGGGTPSLLQPDQIQQIIWQLSQTFCLTDIREVTLEANPATVTKDRINAFYDAGINRLSIGVQSFLDKELALLGRLHSSREAIHFLQSAIDSQIPEISVDLIYGLPGQTIEDWDKILQKALSFNLPHLSTYSLTWSEKTPLGQRIISGELPAPLEEDVIEMALHASTLLGDSGYEQYEVSNFAQPGHLSRHNEGYWKGEVYIGLGPSAHSFLEPDRWWNVSDVEAYCNDLLQDKLSVESRETLSPEQLRLEKIALGLRCRDGVSITQLKLENVKVNEIVQQGLGECENGKLILTPNGLLLADEIAVQLS